jgi:hypothetical protein
MDDMRLSWSQSNQELFALTMVDGKRGGTFLEIGAAWAIAGNNTYILEKYFHYRGISIDIVTQDGGGNDYLKEWQEERPCSNFLVQDAVTIDYSVLLENYPTQIDYLQIDVNAQEDGFLILESLLSTDHRFSAITFETDVYADENGDHVLFKNLARQTLEDSGYELLIENVGCINGKPEQTTYGQLVPFEDWYIDPRDVDPKISRLFQNIGSDIVDPEKIFWD